MADINMDFILMPKFESQDSSFQIPMFFPSNEAFPFLELNKIFKEAIEGKDYHTLVQLMNSKAQFFQFDDHVMHDPEYRKILIQEGNSESILNQFLHDHNFPEIFEESTVARILNLKKQNELMFSQSICDMIYEGVNCDPSEENRFNRFLSLLLQKGLDPNMSVRDKPMFMTAFEAHNYPVIEMLLQHPGFVLTSSFLEEINKTIAPLDQIRETILGRLRPEASRNKKRSRYELE